MDTSKMTAAEYAAFTGAMSHPVGQQEADLEAVERQAYQAADADYVFAFTRALEDPDMRLITEKPHDWQSWGAMAKAAILAAVGEGVASMRARAAVKAAESLVTKAKVDRNTCKEVAR